VIETGQRARPCWHQARLSDAFAHGCREHAPVRMTFAMAVNGDPDAFFVVEPDTFSP
jgi:hypothetical protein